MHGMPQLGRPDGVPVRSVETIRSGTRFGPRRWRLVDAMSREGGPAPHSPADRAARARITLRSCRERLRAAVRSLSLDDPDPSARGFLGGDAGMRDRSAETARDVQAAEQAYDELFTNINHDVKTSLTVIRGHAQMMARALRRGDAIDRDALLAALKVIDASVQRISTELDSWIDDTGADRG